MKHKKSKMTGILYAAVGLIASAVVANTVFAHCDTMNGPIIPEAKAALEKGDLTPVLKWVKKENEGEIKNAFAKAVTVRTKGPEAQDVAEQYFLETLIRLHRLGEGAPFTGIKDAPVEPIVAMADNALAAGSADQMLHDINRHMGHAVREKFNKALAAEKNKDQSVAAGRAFVEAYVIYMHFVEAIHSAIVSDPSNHSAH